MQAYRFVATTETQTLLSSSTSLRMCAAHPGVRPEDRSVYNTLPPFVEGSWLSGVVDESAGQRHTNTFRLPPNVRAKAKEGYSQVSYWEKLTMYRNPN